MLRRSLLQAAIAVPLVRVARGKDAFVHAYDGKGTLLGPNGEVRMMYSTVQETRWKHDKEGDACELESDWLEAEQTSGRENTSAICYKNYACNRPVYLPGKGFVEFRYCVIDFTDAPVNAGPLLIFNPNSLVTIDSVAIVQPVGYTGENVFGFVDGRPSGCGKVTS